jgi:hypothetical protein
MSNYDDRDVILPAGKRIYGVTIGIAIMDRRFPRPVGDIGHPGTFAFPVIYDVVHGVKRMPFLTIEQVENCYAPLLESCKRLCDQGASAIMTTCGFAAVFQRRLASDLPVLFAASSLIQIPTALQMIAPGKRLGVLAANGGGLTPRHLEETGITPEQAKRLVTIGLDRSPTWTSAILETTGRQSLDVGALRREIVALCLDAVKQDPSIGGFVAEAANVGVYSPAVQAATNLPVWDAVTLIDWMYLAARRTYSDKIPLPPVKGKESFRSVYETA